MRSVALNRCRFGLPAMFGVTTLFCVALGLTVGAAWAISLVMSVGLLGLLVTAASLVVVDELRSARPHRGHVALCLALAASAVSVATYLVLSAAQSLWAG